MGWATDGGEDIGGQMADYDAWQEEINRIYDIKEDRVRRTKELSGKYVVITKGISSGKKVFLQDPKISKKGYWTQFISNALGFDDAEKAKLIARGFKHNNPQVAFVNSQGIYTCL